MEFLSGKKPINKGIIIIACFFVCSITAFLFLKTRLHTSELPASPKTSTQKTTGADSSASPENLNDIRQLIYKKNYNQALSLLSKIKQNTPENAESWLLSGKTYLMMGNMQKAVEDLTESIRLKPINPQAFADRGEALYLSNRFPEAQKDFETAEKQESDDFNIYFRLGELYKDDCRHQKALDIIQKGYSKYKWSGALILQAEIYIELCQWDNAVKVLSEAEKTDLPAGNVLARKAVALCRMGNMKEGFQCFEKAIQAKTTTVCNDNLKNSSPHIERAKVLMDIGLLKEALADFNYKESKIGKSQYDIIPDKALIYEGLGMKKQAVAEARKWLSSTHSLNSPENVHNYAFCYHIAGDNKKALRFMDRAVRQEEILYDYLLDRAWLHARIGNKKEALADCRRALQRIHKNNPVARLAVEEMIRKVENNEFINSPPHHFPESLKKDVIIKKDAVLSK
jgi:tetratricopeptide (TPR) repeat protein